MAKEDLGKKFPGLRKCLFASRFPLGTTDETKEDAFQHLVQILLDKRVFTTTGKFCDCRENALDYLMEVLPCLEEEEIQLIFTNPNSFYKKFCFSPSQNTCSLYSKFRNLEINGVSRDVIFDAYYADKGLSPYELVEDRDIVDSFLDDFEAEAEEPALLFDLIEEFE